MTLPIKRYFNLEIVSVCKVFLARPSQFRRQWSTNNYQHGLSWSYLPNCNISLYVWTEPKEDNDSELQDGLIVRAVPFSLDVASSKALQSKSSMSLPSCNISGHRSGYLRSSGPRFSLEQDVTSFFIVKQKLTVPSKASSLGYVAWVTNILYCWSMQAARQG